MLDLNLKIFSSYNEDQLDRQVPLTTTTGEEASSSTTTDSAFITFGILKREDEVVPPKETGDLFPVSDSRRNIVEDSQWLSLSSLEKNTPKMVKKSRRGPRSRSSQYRGVTFYRRTGRWESHIWDCGKQVYLGGFDTAYAAARAYDRAAIKFRGLDADINFVVDDYRHDIDKMKTLNKVEFVQTLRRESASFGRGSSKYKALALQKCTQFKTHHDQIRLFQNRRWDGAAIHYNGLREREGQGAIKFGNHIKGNNTHNDLELSLGISSSANIKLTRDNYYKGINRGTMGLLGKQSSSIYVPMTTMKPLKRVGAASSGFPFITMTTSSSSISNCFDP